MNWTKTPPDKPGWYWLWDGLAELVQIIQGSDSLYVYYLGTEYKDNIRRFSTNYWQGPIEVPNPPEG